MQRQIILVLFASLSMVHCESEDTPPSSLTKFRDLTFFNNLVHFMGESSDCDSNLECDHGPGCDHSSGSCKKCHHSPGYSHVSWPDHKSNGCQSPGCEKHYAPYSGYAPSPGYVPHLGYPQYPGYPNIPNYPQYPGFPQSPGYSYPGVPGVSGYHAPGYGPGYGAKPGYPYDSEYIRNPVNIPELIQPPPSQERQFRQNQGLQISDNERNFIGGREDIQQGRSGSLSDRMLGTDIYNDPNNYQQRSGLPNNQAPGTNYVSGRDEFQERRTSYNERTENGYGRDTNEFQQGRSRSSNNRMFESDLPRNRNQESLPNNRFLESDLQRGFDDPHLRKVFNEGNVENDHANHRDDRYQEKYVPSEKALIGTDPQSGRERSKGRPLIPTKNVKLESNAGLGKPRARPVLKANGVNLEVGRGKKIAYDTEFSLSLKWRPANTAKSIKKMFLYIPKRLEQTAFNLWETLRGGSSKAYGVVRNLMKGPLMDNLILTPNIDGGSTEDSANCEDGSCIDDLSNSLHGDDASDTDEGESEGIVPAEEVTDEEDTYEADELQSGSDSEDDLEEEISSNGDWSYEEVWNRALNETTPELALREHYPSVENNPFFVRLSSYEPEKKETKELDPGASSDQVKDSSKISTNNSVKVVKSRNYKPVNDAFKEEVANGSLLKTAENPPEQLADEFILKIADESIAKLTDDSVLKIADEALTIDGNKPSPKTISKQKHRQKRKRQRPTYVLVDSDILVNTICPHMLSDFKSSPQQFGKKMLVSVRVRNTTNTTMETKKDLPRFFPGDHVSSKASFLAKKSLTLAFGIFLSLIPL